MSKLEHVLSGKSDKEVVAPKDKLIGFFGDPQMAADLNLAAAAMGMDKSKLLRKVVGDWLIDNDPLKMLIGTVKKLIEESVSSQEMKPKEAKAKIRAFLKEKKVADDLIEKVLKSV